MAACHTGVWKGVQTGRGNVLLPSCHLLAIHQGNRVYPCAQPVSAELTRVEVGSSRVPMENPGQGVVREGTCHSPSYLSLQFRENVQDVLPTLPNPDDYFLLRWLRGEGRGAVGGWAGSHSGPQNCTPGNPAPRNLRIWRIQPLEPREPRVVI